MIIEVKNLIKKFKDFTAVDNISFTVKDGEILAFLGPNGAGKTTTIKMLTTVLKPTSGEIKIGGYNPVTQKDKARHSFGIVFQDSSVDDDLTAYENMYLHAVLYGLLRSKRAEKIQQLLEFVELWDRRRELVKTFSGGMKRRLEIAKGLLHHPKILFLDEPTQGLDPQTRNHIWEYIKKMNVEEKMTVFFTTHYIEEAEKVADRVFIVDQGQIVAMGTPDELKQQTSKDNLEDAFIELTGHIIRDEKADGAGFMRQAGRMGGWRR
ncbi:MAG: ATP-binding cassette domain-containing protein [Candidatus Falkowbacteria bacterium]|nr:ATP-binding cassette domain-containing protein [Candidatus Falkowbacteria bacterium]